MQVFARCVYFIVTFISSDFLHCSNINMSNKHFSESLNRHDPFFLHWWMTVMTESSAVGLKGVGERREEKRRKKGA